MERINAGLICKPQLELQAFGKKIERLEIVYIYRKAGNSYQKILGVVG